MSESQPIRVVIADDEALIASSLSTLLSLEEDIDVIGTFASGEELLEWWQKNLTTGDAVADVGVLDLNMTASTASRPPPSSWNSPRRPG